jgi:uncharacterized membrane protein SpoIIM required for sporulation
MSSSSVPTLRSYRFRREREDSWHELEGLLDRVEIRGLRSLEVEQLYRLPVLYRAALSSLSVARAISLDKNVVDYLEALAARAYGFVYASQYSLLAKVRLFLWHRYPELVRAMRGWVVAAILVLVAGTLTGYLLTTDDPERFESFVSEEMASGRSPLSTREELLEVLHSNRAGRADALGAFASFLFTHNARIGLSCYVAGIAAGAPVALLVFINGLTLGAFAALYSMQGLGLEFWAWVLPHGVTELLAVCLCAAAGFKLGVSLVFPGRLSRLDSLARAGREAASVVVGTVVLFFMAALVEGFFRQLIHSETVRMLVASGTSVFWIWYFTSAGRASGPREDGMEGVEGVPRPGRVEATS